MRLGHENARHPLQESAEPKQARRPSVEATSRRQGCAEMGLRWLAGSHRSKHPEIALVSAKPLVVEGKTLRGERPNLHDTISAPPFNIAYQAHAAPAPKDIKELAKRINHIVVFSVGERQTLAAEIL